MKFVLMTSPAFGNNFLKELLISGLRPEFVVTTSPFKVNKSNPVKYPFLKLLKFLKFYKNRGELEKKYQTYFLAKKYRIPIFPTHLVNSKVMENRILSENIDYVFTFIFKILKPNIFSSPRIASINFHPSDLPLNRGATPWNWIIRQQKSSTKISFHHINNEIDGGKIIKQIEVPLPKAINSSILKEFLFNLGSSYFVQFIFELKHNQVYEIKENDPDNGSYEKPYGLKNSIISGSMNANEMMALVNASRDSRHYAQFMISKEMYDIVHCIELNNFTLRNVSLPLINDEGDILIKTLDAKILLLITNKINQIGK